jgi:sugar (pentulose or hexulose) kinase
MQAIPVILIFDVGKTNKKLFLFNINYEIVFESSTQFEELIDEDGFPCDDIIAITDWIKNSVVQLRGNNVYEIKAIHYSGYGASFVYIDEEGKAIEPIYNYLKPFKASTKKLFEDNYGDIDRICLETASPDLDNLNSGLQLYRIKIEQPELYKKIKWALHLPQYLHFVVTGELYTDLTSIGCHTMLWNFNENTYHHWVFAEGINEKFPPIHQNVGLHDSSSALIPYLSAFNEDFVLISTGTWCISLNPFNQSILTKEELKSDTLCFKSIAGNSVKASRVFIGKEHEVESKKLSKLYNNKIDFDEAYEKLMEEMVKKQVQSTNLILQSNTKKIFVDGGFSKNKYYLRGLAFTYPEIEIYSSTIAQASAIGAALVVHESWNPNPKPKNLIELRRYND